MSVVTDDQRSIEIQIERARVPCNARDYVVADAMPDRAIWTGCFGDGAKGEFIQFAISYLHDGIDPELLNPPVDAIWLLATDPLNMGTTGYALRVGPAVYLKRR